MPKTFITVQTKYGDEIFDTLVEATEYIHNSFDEVLACDFVRDIYESNEDGDPIEGGKRYGCNWGLTLEEL